METFIKGCAWFVIFTFPTSGLAVLIANAIGLIT
jgi:hypothetical protein